MILKLNLKRILKQAQDDVFKMTSSAVIFPPFLLQGFDNDSGYYRP
jgi:hypothetical protein